VAEVRSVAFDGTALDGSAYRWSRRDALWCIRGWAGSHVEVVVLNYSYG